jgi:hypothetical protein
MAKKSSKRPPKLEPASGAEGDLRRVPALVEGWLAGDEDAASTLTGLGRDAAHPVLALAEARRSPELAELGRRLLATPPQVATNLLALREASVAALVARVKADAPRLDRAREVEVEGGAFALFDPARVTDALARGGRPRRDAARLGAGDIAWVGLPTAGRTVARLAPGAAPPGLHTLELRLAVESGVVFAGPPEAADGPRLGAVRRDPFSTALDEYRARGAFLRLKAGTYRLQLALADEDLLLVHLAPDPSPAEPLAVELDSLGAVPRAAPAGEA